VGDVVALHGQLIGGVKSCARCPLAVLVYSPLGPAGWECAGEKHRALGLSRDTESSPSWCPLRRQPILIKWVGDDA